MQVAGLTIHFFRTTGVLPLSGKEVPRIQCSIHPGACATTNKPCGTEGTAVAYTDCSPKDNNRPVTGRKIAMYRALRALGLDKQQREAIWTAFHAKYGIPKPQKSRRH